MNIKQRIRKIGKESNLINSFYWKYLYCPVALQIDLKNLKGVGDGFKSYTICELTFDSPKFEEYVEFVNVSYNEKYYTANELKGILSNHHYLNDVRTFVLMDKKDSIVGTISAGKCKENSLCGGVIKFATKKTLRGRGIGLFLLQYAYYDLKKRGCLFGESIVSYRSSRIPSLMTHFKCGFKPQTNKMLIQNRMCQKSRIVRGFTDRWSMKYYNLFLIKHSKK